MGNSKETTRDRGVNSKNLHFYITLVWARTYYIKRLLAREGYCSMGAASFRREGWEGILTLFRELPEKGEGRWVIERITLYLSIVQAQG